MQQTLDPAADTHRRSAQSTAGMRQSVSDRVRGWKTTSGLVISFDHRISRGSDHLAADRLGELSRTARAAGAAESTFRQVAGDPGASTIRYETFERWDNAQAFLAYWESADVERLLGAIKQLQAGPSRYSLREDTVHPLRTGQTQSWDATGAPRPDEADAGDDGYWESGRTFLGTCRFRDNHDGTVTDTLTDLIWLKNANAFAEVDWPTALYTASQLGTGQAGLSDGSTPGEWRLPNVNEMESLLDLSKTFGPALPADSPFNNLEAANYWTSSSVAMDRPTPLGWFVALAVGPPVFDLKFNRMRMWPVRGHSSYVLRTGQQQCYDILGFPVSCEKGRGQDADVQAGAPWPPNRFTNNDDGTVTDALTGLVWVQNADTFNRRLSWQDAIDKCDALESGDYDLDDDSKPHDWRLPNINELRSLVDYSQFAPALPRDHPFSNVRSSLYWSSTTVASAPAFARFCFIGVGPSVWDHKSVLMNVWPVRDRLSSSHRSHRRRHRHHRHEHHRDDHEHDRRS